MSPQSDVALLLITRRVVSIQLLPSAASDAPSTCVHLMSTSCSLVVHLFFLPNTPWSTMSTVTFENGEWTGSLLAPRLALVLLNVPVATVLS